ncbi:hypothetical protein [Brevundimonas sp.]|uniref:hypothetical protein n=1 Tax=Brevundimonas sp. TaxID=1871086 RepID=UPI001DB4F395|nr:hypothetical protein [Brevundimonas sp.]MBL0946812.1 hypothetical protein [Brevundimonas sp.]
MAFPQDELPPERHDFRPFSLDKGGEDFVLFGAGGPDDEDPGTPVDDIEVVGGRGGFGSATSVTIGDNDSQGGLDDLGGGSGSGGGLPQDPDRPDGWNACEDREADRLASLAAALLAQLEDIDTREYGFFIYRDENGDLQLGSMISGDNNSLTGLNPGSVPADFGFTSWNQVVGIIHSHPNVRFHDDGYSVNVDLSDGHFQPSSRDWEWPDFLVSEGADGTNFTQYIYFDGIIYEYDFYENSPDDDNRVRLATNDADTCGEG